MDPIASLLVDAAITGIIIFFFQRRTEHNFARKLEAFKAELANSNFQQQTKFARSHAKRVEVLETLYQRLKALSDVHAMWFVEASDSYQKNSPMNHDDHLRKVVAATKELNDLVVYFESNRLFLPDNAIGEIERICDEAEHWHGTIRGLLLSEHDPSVASGSTYMLYKLAEDLEKLYKSLADAK